MSANASPPDSTLTFADLGLPENLLNAVRAVGYEIPSPIQASTIPPMLEGRDVLGQAQTGTGKTAAFALPILAHIDLSRPAARNPQALVLAPTRELAIQVAEAFQKYAAHFPGFHVLPIYGGQSYTPQLRGLQRGAHVVVGTPGRVIDHLDKKTLDLSNLQTLVLDEADEMLRMGFVDDVERILQNVPEKRRIALFSATMPRQIARIAETYLRDPVRVAIAAKTTTAATVRQRYWSVSGMHKLDALTRILEVENFDAMIVFSRTKQGTEELAEKLEARGFRAAAINGDVVQAIRERTIQKLKDGHIDILVATDVAARGLDVERISHVINFDIPVDTESYVHRIGRTGRAGRSGEAILFVTPRERHLLRAIERATRQPIESMLLPGVGAVNEVRIARFKDRIKEAIAAAGFDEYQTLVGEFEQENNIPAIEIAAALAKMVHGKKPLLLNPDRVHEQSAESFSDKPKKVRAERGERPERFERSERPARAERPERADRRERDDKPAYMERQQPVPKFARFSSIERDGAAPDYDDEDDDAPRRAPRPRADRNDGDKETYKVHVGHMHRIKPSNLVGAIANEAGLDSRYIGRIDIFDDHTLIDLPAGMDAETLGILKRVRVAQQPLRIEPWDGKGGDAGSKFASKKPRDFDAPRAKFGADRGFSERGSDRGADRGSDRGPDRAPPRGDDSGYSQKPKFAGKSFDTPFVPGKNSTGKFGDKPKTAKSFDKPYGGKPDGGFSKPKRKPSF